MIRAVTDKDELYGALGEAPDIYTEKIRAFADSYGFGYYFCRFWVQDDGAAVICAYYSDAVLAAAGELSDSQAEELTAFLTVTGLRRSLMSYRLCEHLGICDNAEKLCLMQWGNDIKSTVQCDEEPVVTDASLVQIYEIAGRAFDIDFDKWYTDTSYMLRHGTAEVYMLEDSACAIRMYTSSGITYLSYVCTLPEKRGQGLARRLLEHICTQEAQKGNKTFVICTAELRGFYESAGFTIADVSAGFTV